MAIVAMLCASIVHAQATFDVTVAPVGGAYRMFNRGGAAGDAPVPIAITAKSLDHAAHHVTVDLSATDFFGAATSWKPQLTFDVSDSADGVTQQTPFPVSPGYYQITLVAKDAGGSSADGWTDLGIIPPSHPGVRPDSMFQSNAPSHAPDDIAFLAAIGMKVQRQHFQPPVASKAKEWPATQPVLPLDFSKQDQAVEQAKAAGIWILPVVGYALQTQGVAGTTDLAHQLGMYGPPVDYAQYVNTWETILRHYPRHHRLRVLE